jgi:hypothetical protein
LRIKEEKTRAREYEKAEMQMLKENAKRARASKPTKK